MPRLFLLAPLLALLPAAALAQDATDPTAASAQGDVAVTIYNNNLALVQDVRQLAIPAGVSRIEFPDVSAQIRPETLAFAADGASIVEQNFDFDLLSPAKLMEKAIGRTVTIVRTNPATGAEQREQAKVLSVQGGVVLQIGQRIEILRDLRLGAFDVLIGINLLREGLDIPECGLVAILDADKEGFLRSETSLVQTIGRAARNSEGRVIMYADRITGSMERAMLETERRRTRQKAYNVEHGITPTTVKKNVEDILAGLYKGDVDMNRVTAKVERQGSNMKAVLQGLRTDMRKAAENLEFEEAARLRDELKRLEAVELAIADDPLARQQAVDKAVEASSKASGRSTAGRGGMRGGKSRYGGKKP